MPRPVTLFTGQWADLPFDVMLAKGADFGYDGLELACWGDHFDVTRAVEDDGYCRDRRERLESHGLNCWSISNHLVGQAVCDRIDERHREIVPARVWGDGEAEGVRERAAAEMKTTARAAKAFGVDVVNGFTGSSIWGDFYFFPPTGDDHIKRGYDDFAKRWGPILDVFSECGVHFALEVHPTEIAYDIPTTEAALSAVGNHPAFGFNFDPSHLVWQGVDPVRFIDRFADRIRHVHMKDVSVTLNGASSIIGSHLGFGDRRRAWDFRSVGRGDVDFEAIIRALNAIGYAGPLSIEWEDAAMDREHGAREACAITRSLDFPDASGAFDAAFARE